MYHICCGKLTTIANHRGCRIALCIPPRRRRNCCRHSTGLYPRHSIYYNVRNTFSPALFTPQAPTLKWAATLKRRLLIYFSTRRLVQCNRRHLASCPVYVPRCSSSVGAQIVSSLIRRLLWAPSSSTTATIRLLASCLPPTSRVVSGQPDWNFDYSKTFDGTPPSSLPRQQETAGVMSWGGRCVNNDLKD